MEYIKKPKKIFNSDYTDIKNTVQNILREIEKNGESSALKFSKKFDNYNGNIELTASEIENACLLVPEKLKIDIQFAHDNIRRFAEVQKSTISDIEYEVIPGLVVGQKSIPIKTAGCYIPGGRYSHIASAIMTITTAKVAGCKYVIACSPPKTSQGIPPPIIYAAHIAGADKIMAIGGVQSIATMAFGLFGLPKANILAGPGNQFVAEAKRILFGRVGIDMIAGPTDSLILADNSADPEIVATDLVGQTEHGYNSPVWLITDYRSLATKVMSLMDDIISDLPEINRLSAEAAWRDFGEIVLCKNREEMVIAANEKAPEHLSVQALDLPWWLEQLESYGSLFLGEETTVAFGDKASGTNHVLPTSGSARYTGGLSVHKFQKIVTWQKSSREAARPIAETTARISRVEGMEAHARTADIRLKKYFPKQKFDLSGDV